MANTVIGQKFQVNDQVNKKVNAGMNIRTSSTPGIITQVREKLNKIGRPGYYYTIKWPDKRTSEHAQHNLTPVL
jgi:hypothetical protein